MPATIAKLALSLAILNSVILLLSKVPAISFCIRLAKTLMYGFAGNTLEIRAGIDKDTQLEHGVRHLVDLRVMNNAMWDVDCTVYVRNIRPVPEGGRRGGRVDRFEIRGQNSKFVDIASFDENGSIMLCLEGPDVRIPADQPTKFDIMVTARRTSLLWMKSKQLPEFVKFSNTFQISYDSDDRLLRIEKLNHPLL